MSKTNVDGRSVFIQISENVANYRYFLSIELKQQLLITKKEKKKEKI